MRLSDSVAVKLMGGLGNQLFQYAAGRAASLRLGCPLVLDLSPLKTRVEGEVERSYMLDVFRIEATLADESLREGWAEYYQPGYCFDPAFAEIGRGTRLNGYFQSEVFFAPWRERLRREIWCTAPLSAAYEQLARRLRAIPCTVSIHLRRGDFVTSPDTLRFHGICGPDYYAKAMRIIEGLRGAQPTYVVFSDDRGAAEALFGNLPSVLFSETPLGAPWEDLFLIAECRDHILANSSFSWWSSWLNHCRDKLIVAPRRWVSPEAMRQLNTADLYLEGTIII
jgi:hypothetical protein